MRRLYWFVSSILIAATLFACSATPTTATQPVSSPPSIQKTESVSPTSPAGPGVTPAVVMKPGDYNQKIKSGGVQRTYILHVPPGYDGSKPLPLVFVLHGFGGAAAGMAKLTGMSSKADQENFFVAYLNGTGDPPGWNNGLMPDLGITTDDVGFVRDLLKQLEQRLQVDSQRVYAAGFSNGAMMTHRLGAELPDLLAGVAIVEGTIGVRGPDGSFMTIPNAVGPIPIIIIHGKQDPNLPYGGGQGLHQYVLSIADAITFWTQADGCTGAPLEASSTGNVMVTDYQTCAAGSEVQLYTIINGEHEWPTSQGHTKFSATDAIWEFFSQHSKGG